MLFNSSPCGQLATASPCLVLSHLHGCRTFVLLLFGQVVLVFYYVLYLLYFILRLLKVASFGHRLQYGALFVAPLDRTSFQLVLKHSDLTVTFLKWVKKASTLSRRKIVAKLKQNNLESSVALKSLSSCSARYWCSASWGQRRFLCFQSGSEGSDIRSNEQPKSWCPFCILNKKDIKLLCLMGVNPIPRAEQ